MSVLNIFTDGSCIKLSMSGCAYFIPKLKIINGINLSRGNTNNTSELRAILIVFQKLQKIKDEIKNDYSEIVIISDSEYAINAISQKNKSIKNLELITKIIKLKRNLELDFTINFKHVLSHTKKDDYYSKGNEIVDNIAKACAINEMKYGNGTDRFRVEKIDEKIYEFYKNFENK